MPFYIEDIAPEDNYYENRNKLVGLELHPSVVIDKRQWIRGFLGTSCDHPLGCSKKPLVNLSFLAVKLRWEDYPSEECRAGLLDVHDSILPLQDIITGKQDKPPVTLASKL